MDSLPSLPIFLTPCYYYNELNNFIFNICIIRYIHRPQGDQGGDFLKILPDFRRGIRVWID